MLVKIYNKSDKPFTFKGVETPPMCYSTIVEMNDAEKIDILKRNRFVSFIIVNSKSETPPVTAKEKVQEVKVEEKEPIKEEIPEVKVEEKEPVHEEVKKKRK